MAENEGSGTRFPFINLEKALGRADALYRADTKGREMSISGAFGVWGYSDKSSGGFQTIAALRMYGLISRVSAGKVALSQEALRYFRDEREDVKAQLLTSFALQPELIAALWKDWKDSPPGDAIARSHLKNDRKLSEQGARTLLAIYKENIAFAGVKGDAMVPPEQEEEEWDHDSPPRRVKLGDYVQWTSGGVDQFRVPRRIVSFLDDTHAQVFGSTTGIPVGELTVAAEPIGEAATLVRASGEASTTFAHGENDFSVLQRGNRLQITADVDLEGIAVLKDMLKDYESILTRLAGKKAR